MVKEYFPTTLQEALSIRAEDQVVPYAGGTDLMNGPDQNASYLFLHQLPELHRIYREGDVVHFGAACTFSETLAHPLTPAVLHEAVSQIAAPAVRNLGTLGGNIANGSAKADSALILMAADAQLKLVSSHGERLLPLRRFYLGRKKLALAQDELIVEILLPTAELDNYYYQKVGARQALAISRVSFVGLLRWEAERIAHCATAFGAISEVIFCRPELDMLLIGKTLKEAQSVRDEYLSAYEQAIVPTEGRVSAAYRKAVCLNLLNAFLERNEI